MLRISMATLNLTELGKLYTLHANKSTNKSNYVGFEVLTAVVMNSTIRGSVVVKALCCKPEGRGFKSRLGGFF
jgi:hypothetical protein